MGNWDLMFYSHVGRRRKPPPEALFPKNSKNLKNNMRRVNESSSFFVYCLNPDFQDLGIYGILTFNFFNRLVKP